MGTIIHNGKTYKGNDLTIKDNKVYIDGVLVEENGKEIIQESKPGFFNKFFGYLKQQTVIIHKIEISGDVKINATHSNITVTGDIALSHNEALVACDVSCNTLKGANIQCNDLNADYIEADKIECDDLNSNEITVDVITCADLNCDTLHQLQTLTVKGDLNCDDVVSNNIHVEGDMNCGDIEGNVEANEINAGTIYMKK